MLLGHVKRLPILTAFTILLTAQTSALATSVLTSYFPCIPQPQPLSHPPSNPLSPSFSSSLPSTQLCILHSTAPSTPPTIDPTLPITITPITANITVFSPLCIPWGSGVVTGYEREVTVWAMGLSFSEPLRVQMVQAGTQTQEKTKGMRMRKLRARAQTQASDIDNADVQSSGATVDAAAGKTSQNIASNGIGNNKIPCARSGTEESNQRNPATNTGDGIGKDAASISREQDPNLNSNVNLKRYLQQRAAPQYQGASPRWTYQGRTGGIENCVCKSGWGASNTGSNSGSWTKTWNGVGEELTATAGSGSGSGSGSAKKGYVMSASPRVDNCACTFECVPFRQVA